MTDVLKKTTVVLTDAQIKSLPTTPVVLIPATDTLGYSGTPTQLVVPVFACAIANFVTGYTNVDSQATMRIAFGSDWSADVSAGTRVSPFTAVGSRFYPFIGEASAVGDILSPEVSTLTDGLEDNAIALACNNQINGVFTGGNAANTLTVTIIYLTVDV